MAREYRKNANGSDYRSPKGEREFKVKTDVGNRQVYREHKSALGGWLGGSSKTGRKRKGNDW